MTNEAYLLILNKDRGTAIVHEQWISLQKTETSSHLNVNMGGTEN